MMNVLSLFDGMSCGQIALERAGIKVENYYASDIDKFAIAVTQHNYPDTVQLGDINNYDNWDLPQIDLLMGGSPCQGFSFAGKQLNFEDDRSKLFFKFVDCLKKFKPKYFLLENVRMKKEYQNVISEFLGVEPIIINSSRLSAQNRVRLYWTNIPNITQPEDKGIVLRDIIEDGEVDEVKSATIKSQYYKSSKANFKRSGSFGVKVNKCIKVGEADLKGHDYLRRVYSETGKAPTLNANGGGNLEPKIICRANVQKHSEYNTDYKKYKGKYLDGQAGMQWRKLTPLECERLQTVKDNYTAGVSNSQRYKMFPTLWSILHPPVLILSPPSFT
jgi:DNA (cytosine-5)-methyltransferase 3A